MTASKNKRSILYRIFEPLIIGFMTLSFPNTDVNVVESIVRRSNLDDDSVKIRKGDLVAAFLKCKNPACDLDLFLLRTRYLGWDISHALKTKPRKNELKLKVCESVLKEIYRNAYRPTVTLEVFLTRVRKNGMEWREALYR